VPARGAPVSGHPAGRAARNRCRYAAGLIPSRARKWRRKPAGVRPTEPATSSTLSAPDGPPRVLVHARCGHDAHPSLQCAHCEQEIRPGELRVRPGAGASERQRTEPLLPQRA